MRFLLRRIEAAMRRRTVSSACVLFAMITLPLLLIMWGLHAYALTHGEVLALYRADRLLLTQGLLSALIVWQVALALAAHRWRGRIMRPALWSAMAIGPTLMGLVALSLAYGVKGTPLGVMMFETLVFARAFFDWRHLRPWMLLGGTLLAGQELLHALDVTPYAPLLHQPIFLGHEFSGWWALWTRVVFNAAAWPVAAVLIVLFSILARQRAELENLARTDMLTGLANRREFMERLAQEAKRAARTARPLSVVMLDVDHFKRINDTLGHEAGDHVLAQLGSLLRSCVRHRIDVAARMGGEEFALLLPDTTLQGARHVAQKIARKLEDELSFDHTGRPLRVTLSMGLAEVLDDRGEQALRAADQHLYTAKRQGRNQLVAGL